MTPLCPLFLFFGCYMTFVTVSAEDKCYTCMEGTIASPGIFPKPPDLKKGLCFPSMADDAAMDECAEAPCVELLYGSGDTETSWVVRGCYSKMMSLHFGKANFTSAKITKDGTYRNGNFLLHVCDKVKCNKEFTISGGKIVDPPPETVRPKETEDPKECMQCVGGDNNFCEKRQWMPCDKTYCMSEIGSHSGVYYEMYGCTDINPYLASGSVAFNSEKQFPLFDNKPNVTRMYCEDNRCNYYHNGEPAMAFFAPLFTLVLCLFFY
uniref:DUF281 domain-containing protein n=1 Tax=Steinernema glaseri TaxID=37863 RepID=A0A1I7ZXT1_9BILA